MGVTPPGDPLPPEEPPPDDPPPEVAVIANESDAGPFPAELIALIFN